MRLLKIVTELEHVALDSKYVIREDTLYQDIVGYIRSVYTDFKNCRAKMEELWLHSWANYFGTEQSNQYLRSRIYKLVGNTKSEWRHKINIGKATEVVETLHAYLMASIFPNENWFDLHAVDPDYRMVTHAVKQYMRYKFIDEHFYTHFANFLRQMIVTGTSVLAVDWKDDNLKYKCLDLFDCFFNPDNEDTDFIRKVRKTRSDIIIGLREGLYNTELMNDFDVVRINVGTPMFSTDDIDVDVATQQIAQFQGIDITPFRMTDKITAYEFWGDIRLPYMVIKDVCVTIIGNKIARIYQNPFKEGKPFVIGTYTPTVRQSYGLSGIQGSLGAIQQLTNMTNQMLDGVELAVNPMYTKVPDGSLRSADVTTEPGKVLEVQSHDTLRPLPPPLNNFGLSVQQFGMLEAIIDKNTGTGPLIGAGQPRGGERVTAMEIAAVQEAGGNRLLNVYTHIQRTSLMLILRTSLNMIRQYVLKDEEFPTPVKNTVGYLTVGPLELKGKYRIYPKGVNHIAEKADYARRRIELLQLLTSLPDVEQRIDIWALVEDIIANVLYEDTTKYMIPQETEEPASNNQTMMSASMAQLLEQNLAADSGSSLMNSLFGVTNDLPAAATELSDTELPAQ